jgi:hypothetical protein
MCLEGSEKRERGTLLCVVPASLLTWMEFQTWECYKWRH